MRLNAALTPALCATALLAGAALAQEDVEPSSSIVEKPTFTVCSHLTTVSSSY